MGMTTVRYLLDTNICIYIAKDNPPTVRERFLQFRADMLAMSVVTLGELRYGAEKSRIKARSLQTIEQLEALIQVAPMTDATSRHYGQIRSSLERVGHPIGNNDLWIAAHARANGWILVTNNEKEFERVEGLTVENWAK